MLLLSGIDKYFGKHLAVEDLSVSLVPGQVLGLLGPNGAGKTTTIRLITGVLLPTKGHLSATVEGISLPPTDPRFKKKMGYCPENPPLYTDMTVAEYLYAVAALRGVAKSKIPAAVRWVLELLELDVENRLLSVLSKGQRQRVNIAQSLVHDPLYWILDEPLAGLDPEQVALVRNLIKQFSDKAILLSSHLLGEVTQVCSDILILKQRQLLVGKLSDLMSVSHAVFLTLSVSPEKVGTVFETCGFSWTHIEQTSENYHVYRCEADTDIRERLFYICTQQNWPIYGLQVGQKPLEKLYLEVIS